MPGRWQRSAVFGDIGALDVVQVDPDFLDVRADDRPDLPRQALEQRPLLLGCPPAPQIDANPDVLRRRGLASDKVRVGLQLSEDDLDEVARRTGDVVVRLGDLRLVSAS